MKTLPHISCQLKKSVAALLRSAEGMNVTVLHGSASTVSDKISAFYSMGKKCGLRGIALLELMLATAIFGMALVTLGIAVGRCLRGLSAADTLQAAMDLAQHRLTAWKIESSLETEIKPGTEEGSGIMHGREFEWRQEIVETDDLKVLKSILTIAWNQGGQEQERTFVSLVQKTTKPPTKK